MKKKRTLRRWSKKEDERLVEILSSHTDNITEGFRAFIKEYPRRSLGSTATRWYSTLRTDNNIQITTTKKEKKKTLFTLIASFFELF